MNKKRVVTVLITTKLIYKHTKKGAQMSKKNLVFIFTDEQSANTMKWYGNNKIHTPNMDKLAKDSVVFENAYVTQPVCTPSRSTLMTGLYPHSNNCTENNIPPMYLAYFSFILTFQSH